LNLLPFLSSKNVYIEINGVRLATANNYSVKISRECIPVESFSSHSPITYLSGKISYSIELSTLSLTDSTIASPIDLFNLSDFNIVFFHPTYQTIFSGCNWTNISEVTSCDKPIIKSISIVASNRIIIPSDKKS
jgi:hypothetical protein